jgi:hypothetical protein
MIATLLAPLLALVDGRLPCLFGSLVQQYVISFGAAAFAAACRRRHVSVFLCVEEDRCIRRCWSDSSSDSRAGHASSTHLNLHSRALQQYRVVPDLTASQCA